MTRFFPELLDIASNRGYKIKTLGGVRQDHLILLMPPLPMKQTRILVAGGFHGDEPAGCWGILDFLKNAPAHLLEQVSISFLPMVNPSGIRRHTPANVWKENTNRGFVPAVAEEEGHQHKPSCEGVLLTDNLPSLLFCAKDGFLTLHEDYERTKFYLYANEHHAQPKAFTKHMVNAGASMCPILPDGDYEEGIVRDGVIFNAYDGSFESLLFFKNGIPRTATTETPGKLDFAFRVKMSSRLIDAFAQFHVPTKNIPPVEWMRSQIDDVINKKKPSNGVLTMRYGGPFRRKKQQQGLD